MFVLSILRWVTRNKTAVQTYLLEEKILKMKSFAGESELFGGAEEVDLGGSVVLGGAPVLGLL